MPSVIVIDAYGGAHTVEAPQGLSLLEVIRSQGLDIEGRCEGSLACSSCHVVVDPAWYPRLPEAEETEQDMLDLVPTGLTATSRLACQILLNDGLDGLIVHLPCNNP
ncbi:MAG TPA: 2Fe-2S iron-sulfur cluster-binding protein [Magnetospirillum sp.]|nr:2Fe-2S iron-sulfur cluster-binding protein [Magnetospirillum sp.]